MSDTPTPTPPPTPRPQRSPSTAGRVLALAGGTVVALVALTLLAVGGVALWANGEKDRDGYLATDPGRITTGTYAIASENLDVDLDGAGRVLDADTYGRVRVQVEPRGDKPLFVGIARTSDVAAYLQGSAHATVTDFDTDPFRADLATAPGTERPTAPADRSLWTASAHGTGTQTLDWEVEDGQWSVVVMNADGSRGVDAGVSVGAEAPFLTAVGWGAIGGGAVLLILAGGLIVLGVRTPRSEAAPGGAAPVPAL